jgi:hypothetical protein
MQPIAGNAHPLAMDTPRSPADEICNRIDSLSNLLYLIKLDLQNADKINIYVAMAESELSRLSDIARRLL